MVQFFFNNINFRYEYDDPKFKEALANMDAAIKVNPMAHPTNIMPAFRHLKFLSKAVSMGLFGFLRATLCTTSTVQDYIDYH